MNSSSLPPSIHVSHVNDRGFGVCRLSPSKQLYLAGALANEEVEFQIRAKHSHALWGVVKSVSNPSAYRTTPRCPSAPGNLSKASTVSLCGGCTLQHMDYQQQVRFKHDRLVKLFHTHDLQTEHWAEPLFGVPYGYRHKARIGVRWVERKNRLLVGFREHHTSRITDCNRCDVLIERIGLRFEALSKCLQSLSVAKYIPQVELSSGEQHAALSVRHLKTLSSDDLVILTKFAADHHIGLYCQSGGSDTIAPIFLPEGFALDYTLLGIKIAFGPTDFIQNNLPLNHLMVQQALHWLAVTSEEKAIDLFCGIGNFSLPMARRCAQVTGVEGNASSVAQAIANAQSNAIDNSQFVVSNLNCSLALHQQNPDWWQQHYDVAIVDPPRSGIGELNQWIGTNIRSRLLYVSCNPKTMVNDIKKLHPNFRILKAGIIDMFPHTTHCEAMCLLEKKA